MEVIILFFIENENISGERQGQTGSRENSLDRMSSNSAASSAKRRTISPRPESLRYDNDEKKNYF